jgi:hypothetical protein
VGDGGYCDWFFCGHEAEIEHDLYDDGLGYLLRFLAARREGRNCADENDGP